MSDAPMGSDIQIEWMCMASAKESFPNRNAPDEPMHSHTCSFAAYRPRRKLDSLIAFRRASLALLVTSWRLPRPSVASAMPSTGASRLYGAGVIS